MGNSGSPCGIVLSSLRQKRRLCPGSRGLSGHYAKNLCSWWKQRCSPWLSCVSGWDQPQDGVPVAGAVPRGGPDPAAKAAAGPDASGGAGGALGRLPRSSLLGRPQVAAAGGAPGTPPVPACSPSTASMGYDTGPSCGRGNKKASALFREGSPGSVKPSRATPWGAALGRGRRPV